MKTFRLIISGFAIVLLVFNCKKDDKCINSMGTSSAVFNTTKEYGTVYDYDCNEYKTIKIGNQTWMAENLRTTHYQNGDTIPIVTTFEGWRSLKTDAYCNYWNTSNGDSIVTFGRIYNGYAATDKRNVAPVGWHVPTQADWDTLANYLGGLKVAGGLLKETGTSHWPSPNTGATNETGFTALPSGVNSYLGYFRPMDHAVWWTSTTPSNIEDYANCYSISYENQTLVISTEIKVRGVAIRCVMD